MMEYRQATFEDIDMFTENRAEFVNVIGEMNNIDDFKARTKKYLEKHIGGDDLIVFLAVERGDIVASSMACIFTMPPLLICYSGKTAELLSVYTKPEFQNQGHAKKLVLLTLEEAKKRGVERVTLTYTEKGLPLYKSLGFSHLSREMELRL